VGPVCEAARSDPKYQRSNLSNHNTSNQNLVSFSCLIRKPDMLRRSNWNSEIGIQKWALRDSNPRPQPCEGEVTTHSQQPSDEEDP